MVTTDEYKRAERELTLADWKSGFRIHAAVYVAVNTALAVLNVLVVVFTAAFFFWLPFVLVGWGIGLTMHYLHGIRWADREIQNRQVKVEERAQRLHLAA